VLDNLSVIVQKGQRIPIGASGDGEQAMPAKPTVNQDQIETDIDCRKRLQRSARRVARALA
jgi:hypothetical protein